MATPPRRPSLQRNAPLQMLAVSSATASPTTSSFPSSTPINSTSPNTPVTTTSLPSTSAFAYTSSPSTSPTHTTTATISALDNTALARARYNSLPSLSPPALQLSASAAPSTTPRSSIAIGTGESWTLQSRSQLGFGFDVGGDVLTPQDMMMDGMMTPRRGGLGGVSWAVDADGDALMLDVF